MLLIICSGGVCVRVFYSTGAASSFLCGDGFSLSEYLHYSSSVDNFLPDIFRKSRIKFRNFEISFQEFSQLGGP